MHELFQKSNKKRLDLMTSYLIKQLLAKRASAKHIILFIRRIVVVFVEDGHGECAHKKKITEEKKMFLIATRVISQLAHLENGMFPSISDLPRSYKAHDNEHT
jgi:hypothetical protein